MLTLLTYLLILWAVIALGCLVAWWLGKRRGEATTGEFSDAVLLTAFVFGLLLGLLQVFVTNHYSDARSQAQTEATALTAMYDDLSAFPPQVRTPARLDLVCYMQSVAQQDWTAQERGDAREAADTVVRNDRLRGLRDTLPQDSPATMAAAQRVAMDVGDAGAARQQLLFLAQPQIPTVLWALVFVSAAVLMYLIVSEFKSRRKIIARAVLISVIVLLTVEIGSLVALDHPFSPVARIRPDAITRSITLLETGRHINLRDCGPPLPLSADVAP